MARNLEELSLAVADVENIFFEAMLAGYVCVDKVKTKDMPGMPGYKFTEFVDSDFCVKDIWCKSSGFTSIWYKGTLIWTMHYGGQYPKECINFLKEALLTSYQARVFNGGRGPSHYNAMYNEHTKHLIAHKKYRYVNNILPGSDFTSFAGKEYICSHFQEEHVIFGWHYYFGGLV